MAKRRTSREVLDLAQLNTVGDIIVVLDKCHYIDSSGLTELIRAHKSCGGRLAVVLPQACVVHRTFIMILGFDKLLNVKRSIAEALQWRIA